MNAWMRARENTMARFTAREKMKARTREMAGARVVEREVARKGGGECEGECEVARKDIAGEEYISKLVEISKALGITKAAGDILSG